LLTTATQIQFCREADPNQFDVTLGGNKIYKIPQSVQGIQTTDCVLWEVKSADDLVNAEVELIKSGWFPIARFYLEPLARRIALRLRPTGVTANHVTYVSFLFGVAAVLCVAVGDRLVRWAALFYLAFWLLDIADGKLARLKKSVSRFGGWLDSVSGELVDYLIHAAVIYSAYHVSGSSGVLWVGIFYFIGKHLFLFAMQAGVDSFKERSGENSFLNTLPAQDGLIKKIIKASHLLHDSDVRIHILSVCFIFNCAWIPLVFYAAYYNVWFVAKIVIEYLRYRKNF